MAWFTRNLRDSETGRISGRELWLRARSAFAVLLSVGVLVGGGSFAVTQIQNAWTEFRTAEDYEGEGVDPVMVEIPAGTTLSQMADILVQHDVIKTAKAFDREAAGNADSKKIQAGRYKLKTQLPAKVALAMLLDKGNIDRDLMTLTEGARLTVQIDQLAKATKLPAKDFEAALKDWKKLGLPKWAKNSAEGFLFPDTYELPQGPKPEKVIKLTTDAFKKAIKKIDFEKRAKKLGVTPYQALIIASIIEKEAGPIDEDRPKIARVIYNRLARGEKLQLDSTVAYAAATTGRVSTTEEERKLDSPYNTYVVKGLPKGPIAAPSLKSLEAAVKPAKGKWRFFVTVNLDTGETEFNEDPAGHQKSANKWYAWCQESDANYKKCYGKDR
ncbi:MAG: endolytic transglycosylase MltG [Propionicimonas sp.]